MGSHITNKCGFSYLVIIWHEVMNHAIALDFCIEMEKNQIVCVPIPTNESQWDKNTNRWRSIVSQKHIAQAAGLGTIGRHSLLITPEFGSMVWLGAVLCEQNLVRII